MAPSLIFLLLFVSFASKGVVTGKRLTEFIRHFEPLRVEAYWVEENLDHVQSKFKFNAHGRNFSIHVETHQTLFHPNFHMVVVEGGKQEVKQANTKGFVIGYIDGEEGSIVHGHVENGVLEGVIYSQGEVYHLEPISRYEEKREKEEEAELPNSVIYKASDVVYNLKHTTCSSAESPRLRLIQESAGLTLNQENYLKRRKRGVDPDKNTCTIRVVADHVFYSKIGQSQDFTTLKEMTFHILNANVIYRATNFFRRNGEEFSGFGLAIHSTKIYKDGNDKSYPYSGKWSVEGLLSAFSEEEFNDVCLGHLFTYRDFQGTIGLAYVGDASGNLAGGICAKRTNTLAGSVSLNTGLTSFLNFGSKLPRAVSYVTVAHEVGHNYGSPHDSSGSECAPGGSQGNYIMYSSATDGSRPNNKLFSVCSRRDMGSTIENNGGCFLPRPSAQVCGNGVVEGDEECDCGSSDTVECFEKDPCCKPGNCTLKEDALCSPEASRCCSDSCEFSSTGTLCLTGDLSSGGCQNSSFCNGTSASCPPGDTLPDGEPCNFGNNVCDHGICNGSVCVLYGTTECYCSQEDQLCEVCCVFNEECVSTFDNPDVANTTVQPGYPCRNFTGYCTKNLVCVFVDNDDVLNDLLDNLKDILFNFPSLVDWIKSNWYWVLAGFVALIILIILLQITYRRKKQKKRDDLTAGVRIRRRNRSQRQGYGYYQRRVPVDENTGLLERTSRT